MLNHLNLPPFCPLQSDSISKCTSGGGGEVCIWLYCLHVKSKINNSETFDKYYWTDFGLLTRAQRSDQRSMTILQL